MRLQKGWFILKVYDKWFPVMACVSLAWRNTCSDWYMIPNHCLLKALCHILKPIRNFFYINKLLRIINPGHCRNFYTCIFTACTFIYINRNGLYFQVLGYLPRCGITRLVPWSRNKAGPLNLRGRQLCHMSRTSLAPVSC